MSLNRLFVVTVISFGIAILACASAPHVCAQAPLNYGQYFQQKTSLHGTAGAPTPSRYLYDTYFYHRPTVSPYMNVFRPDTMSGTAYQAYVRPELQRREASSAASRAYVQQRKLEGRVGETRYPGAGFVGGTPSSAYMKPAPTQAAMPSAYYNHWYGGWKNR